MSTLDLEHVMERIGRITSGDSMIDVSVRGAAALSRPGRVVLPAVERYECLGADNAERIIHGLGDHEFGHAQDTDFEAWDRVTKSERKAFVALVNVLEDAYVEGRRGIRYPGARYNLAKKNAWFWETDFSPHGQPSVAARIADPSRTLWERFLLGLCFVARVHGGQSIDCVERVDAVVGRMLRMVEHVIQKLPALYHETRQTAATIGLAWDVWELLHGDADDAAQLGESTGGDSDGASGAQQQLDFASNRGRERSRKLPPEIDLGIGRFECEPAPPLNPEDMVQARVRTLFDQPASTRPYVVFDQSFDIERDFSGEWGEQLSASYERYRKEAESATDDLVSTFEAALRDVTRRRISFDGDEEGEIDTALLPSFSLGAAHPEELWIDYHAELDGGQAAVALLIDCSGSMGNGVAQVVDRRTGVLTDAPSKSHVARLCAIAMHEALKRCQVPHEINGFTTLHDEHVGLHPWAPGRQHEYEARFAQLRKLCNEAIAQGTDLTKFARTWVNGAVQVPFYGTFKGFGHEDGRALTLVAGISNNLDGEAILWQARRLARRAERRKVMVVLSDGHPVGSNDNAVGARHLAEAVQRAMGAGIEVLGIGVQDSAVKAYYPRWWVVDRLDQLPAVMIRALMETVIEPGSSTTWTR